MPSTLRAELPRTLGALFLELYRSDCCLILLRESSPEHRRKPPSCLKLQVRDSAEAVASQSFSLLVVSASASGSGNSYYVDSAGGDDSNNGTSASSPWRTIAKVNARNFSPGDHILFKRGDTWRELLAISSSGADNPIVIDAYGNGAAPMVAGTDLVPQSAWTLCSSCQKNVWKAKVPTQPNLVTFDGTNGEAQTSISALSASGDWYWPRMNCMSMPRSIRARLT